MSAMVSPEVVSCLDSICKQAFLMLTCMDALPARDPSSTTFAVACRISIEDDLGGKCDVLVRGDQSFATCFTQRLFDIPSREVAEEDTVDAIKELANTVGGNLKGIMEASTSLSIPEAVFDPDPFPTAHCVTRLRYCFADAGECVVELCDLKTL